MGQLVVTEFVSLDGVMQAPGGEPGYAHTGWVAGYHDGDHMAFKLEEILAAQAHLLGRVTYESFAGAWPDRTDEAGFSDKMNAMPKHVVSSTLRPEDLEWHNSHLVEGGLDGVAAVRDATDGVLLVAGSRRLVHGLLERDLVDELRLMVFPLILGSGDRVYPERAQSAALDLADSRTYDSGVVVLTYTARR